MANEVVGTLYCNECKEQASVLQTKRGKGKNLYRRCGCGCDQRTGAAIQKKWAVDMIPRAGFEHLKQEQPEPVPEQPQQTTEPVPSQKAKPEPVKTKGLGIFPVLGAVAGVGLLILTAGKSGG
jgi:hypothetical protein